MTSILLLTLLSKLHCHPEIGSTSLLPVANVVVSLVPNVPLLFTKSAVSFAAVKPDGRGEMVAPLALNRLSQSRACVPFGGLGPGGMCVTVLDRTSPSSWKFRSCTAC